MKAKLLNYLRYIFVGLIVAMFMFPIVWVIMLSLKPPEYNFTIPPSFIFPPTLRHYWWSLVDPGYYNKHIYNSIILSSVATVMAIALSAPAAYAFSRFGFKLKNFLMGWYLGLYLAPPIVFLTPYYFIMKSLGLIGTYPAIWIAFQIFSVPLGVWLLKNFFDEVPRELEEAAMLDGCGRLRALIHIILPVGAPGFIITALFIFVFCWNNLLFPMALGGPEVKPLTLSTMEHFRMIGVTWNYIATGSVFIMTIPAIIFIIFRRYLVRGLMLGAAR